MSAFFTLHRDLPREGPGEAADVAWATALAQTPADAAIADLACGPGADIAALLAAAPEGHVTGIDKQQHFVDAVNARFGDDPRVTARQGDMAQPDGQFDLIWCAGALYILGLQKGLRGWRTSLRPGGAIAFSQPCYFASNPSDAAMAFWGGDEVLGQPALAAQIGLAGYALLGTRRLSDAAWEAYYQPQDARIDQLWPDADDDLRHVLTEAREEAQQWRAVRAETGYLLCVVRPV